MVDTRAALYFKLHSLWSLQTGSWEKWQKPVEDANSYQSWLSVSGQEIQVTFHIVPSCPHPDLLVIDRPLPGTAIFLGGTLDLGRLGSFVSKKDKMISCLMSHEIFTSQPNC